jgi:hypothetical protein
MLALVPLCVIRSGQLSRKSHASVAVLVSGSAHIDHRSGPAGRVVWGQRHRSDLNQGGVSQVAESGASGNVFDVADTQ